MEATEIKIKLKKLLSNKLLHSDSQHLYLQTSFSELNSVESTESIEFAEYYFS